jgi:hypothetical protein
VKAVLLFALIMGPLLVPKQCTENIQLNVIRQEKYNGCGSDFIGADMRVIYQLVNKTNHSIYVFGFTYDHLFSPTGYSVIFGQKNQGWNYPTGNNRPVSWTDRSSLVKSTKRIEPGKSIEFDACHTTRKTEHAFARTIYISSDPKAVPDEFISDKYSIMRFE